MAALLGRPCGLPGRGRRSQAEALRARHVPLPLRRRACMSAIPRATRRPTSCAATSGCAASTCCTRWAGTRSACPPSVTPCAPACIPAITTQQNIDTFRGQIKRLGFSYDWSRELSTTDPDYVRWTQWIFLQLYKRGLAYQAEVAGQLVSGAEHRAGERGGEGRPLRRDRRPGRTPADAAMDAARSPPTPIGCWRTSRTSTGPRASRRCSATGSAGPRAPTWRSAIDGNGADASPSSRPARTRCLAPPIACWRRNIRWSSASRRAAQRAAVDAYRDPCRAAERLPAHGAKQGQERGVHRGVCGQSGERRAHSDLGRRLCADVLWHRRHHGGAGA